MVVDSKGKRIDSKNTKCERKKYFSIAKATLSSQIISKQSIFYVFPRKKVEKQKRRLNLIRAVTLENLEKWGNTRNMKNLENPGHSGREFVESVGIRC